MIRAFGRCIRALCARLTPLVLALALAAQQDVRAAEPPPKHAYHVSVLNGGIIGSAFMIDHGVVVTNAHVVAGRLSGQQVNLLTPTGQRIAARIEAVSTDMDLAVLSVRGTPVHVVPKSHGRVKRGAQVVAVGIAAHSGNPRQRHVVSGVIASGQRALAPFGRGVIARMPRVQSGFSGGPVFDRNGSLVGMVAALRPAQSSPSGRREAFILSAEEVRAEALRLISD